MARRSGLGRGLGALIPAGSNEPAAIFSELAVSAIVANPNQPRTQFDEESMAALTASVRELGVIQPVLVRAVGEGSYELIAGERRWRAAKRAGVPVIPAVIRHADDTASLEQALVENIQREDLGPLDEAAAYQQLLEDFHLTHDELAMRMGKSRSAISNALRLFHLPPAVQRLLVDGQISAGHARALLSTPDRNYQEKLAQQAVDESLSVRVLEERARLHNQDAAPEKEKVRPRPQRLRPPGLLELEELLSIHLETRVKVEMGAKRGRVLIDFATLEDLERIYRIMTEPDPPRS